MPTLVNPCTATATQWRDLERALKAQFELNLLLEEIERLLKRRKRGLGGGGENREKVWGVAATQENSRAIHGIVEWYKEVWGTQGGRFPWEKMVSVHKKKNTISWIWWYLSYLNGKISWMIEVVKARKKQRDKRLKMKIPATSADSFVLWIKKMLWGALSIGVVFQGAVCAQSNLKTGISAGWDLKVAGWDYDF